MRHNVFFGAVLVTVLFLGLGNVIAQQPATPVGCVQVVDGDNLWTLDHNFNIAALAAKNPDLRPPLDSPMRQFTTKYNQLGVKIFANQEIICGVTRKGSKLIPTLPAPHALAASLTPVPQQTRSSNPAQPMISKTAQVVVGGSLFLILLAAVALALTIWLLRQRNPAGLPPRRFAVEGVRLGEANTYSRSLGEITHPGRTFVIISQTRQRARGAVISQYLNPARQETVVLDGGPNSYVYRTRLRFTDVAPNEETEMPFLAACGNPILYGTIARYFPGLNFEYLGEPEIVPEPVPAAAEPATEPAPPAASEPEPAPVAAVVAAPEATKVLAGIELPVQAGNPSFKMSRLTDGTVVIELAASSGAQFMLTVPAASVYYANGRFSFDASGLPVGLTVPVPAEIIAAAAVRQLTAPVELEPEPKASVMARGIGGSGGSGTGFETA